jgi:hypothetical protein
MIYSWFQESRVVDKMIYSWFQETCGTPDIPKGM